MVLISTQLLMHLYKWTRAYLDKGSGALKYQKRGPKTKSEINE